MLSFTMLQPPLDVLRLLVYGEIGMTQLFSKILACAHSYPYFFIHVRTFAEISVSVSKYFWLQNRRKTLNTMIYSCITSLNCPVVSRLYVVAVVWYSSVV